MKKRSEALPGEGTQYHIQLKRGDLSPYVLLPGDPGRVAMIASCWDDYTEVAHRREYKSVTGTYKERSISCVSTGVGSPSAGIAVEELCRIGCHTLIRVGSCGAIQDIPCGDLIINTGSIRFEGTSKEYIFPEYPAVANYEVVLSLVEACEILGVQYHLGIGATTDSFYLGQARCGYEGFFQSRYDRFVEDLQQASVLNFDMEASCIMTVSMLYGVRAGAVCTVFANRVTGEFRVSGEQRAGMVASEAVSILHEWDEKKKKQGKKWCYPSLLAE